MKDFTEFEKATGFTFKNKTLLKQAFTHRSYINENPGAKLEHNERLEFLGDAVMELVVTDFLYRKYPEKPEGELTSFRAALVNTQSISKAAQSINANDFLLLSKGEAKDEGKARQYILANTFEAIIGAIYIDQGYKQAAQFIETILLPYLNEVVANRLWQDNKSYFQERAQEATGITPNYEVMKESGPDHDKEFTVGLFLGSKQIASGSGRSKQEAEQEAAKNGLSEKGWE